MGLPIAMPAIFRGSRRGDRLEAVLEHLDLFGGAWRDHGGVGRDPLALRRGVAVVVLEVAVETRLGPELILRPREAQRRGQQRSRGPASAGNGVELGRQPDDEGCHAPASRSTPSARPHVLLEQFGRSATTGASRSARSSGSERSVGTTAVKVGRAVLVWLMISRQARIVPSRECRRVELDERGAQRCSSQAGNDKAHGSRMRAFDGAEDRDEAPPDEGVESLFASLAYLFDDHEPPVDGPPKRREEPSALQDEDPWGDEPTRIRPNALPWATTRSTSMEIPIEARPPQWIDPPCLAAPVTGATTAEKSPPARKSRSFTLPALRPRPVRTLPPPLPARPPPLPPVPTLRAESHPQPLSAARVAETSSGTPRGRSRRAAPTGAVDAPGSGHAAATALAGGRARRGRDPRRHPVREEAAPPRSRRRAARGPPPPRQPRPRLRSPERPCPRRARACLSTGAPIVHRLAPGRAARRTPGARAPPGGAPPSRPGSRRLPFPAAVPRGAAGAPAGAQAFERSPLRLRGPSARVARGEPA